MSVLPAALFLGLVEGLTEFIPVSSTSHLILLVDQLKFPAPPGHVFEVFIQLGAILAVIVHYRRKITDTALEFFRSEKARHFALSLLLASLPVLVAGFFGNDWIKTHLYDFRVIAAALLAGGVVILALDKRFGPPRIDAADAVPLKTSFLIGCCQMLALIPGVSRSGATIIGALACGLSRPAAAEFSFFLAIPVMFAAVGYDTARNWQGIVSSPHLPAMLAGLLAAFITALAIMKFALYLINKYGFSPFAWYRILAGIVILWIFL